MITPQKYARKTFVIEAIQVTAENIEDVAKWCEGTVLTAAANHNRPESKYIKVQVHHPLNERQTKAFANDWVLRASAGFKVYTPKAFDTCFDPVGGDDFNYGEVLPVFEEAIPKLTLP